MKLTGENRSTRGKTCPRATLSITNPTWTDPGSHYLLMTLTIPRYRPVLPTALLNQQYLDELRGPQIPSLKLVCSDSQPAPRSSENMRPT
jgi:hypothetical protein